MLQPLPADVAAAMQRGDKIEAIKRLRAHSGLGLAEAKDAVERGEYEHRAAPSPAQAAAGLPADVAEALAAGQQIEAIKRLRAATGLGLKEAKDVIDAAAAALPRRGRGAGSTIAAGDGALMRNPLAWIVALALLAAGAWFVLR